MQTNPASALRDALSRIPPSDNTVFQASAHLTTKTRRDLSSDDVHTRANARGEFYEAFVYESILDIAEHSNLIARVVAKGPDVPLSHRTRATTLSQNGLFYNSKSSIVIRGNGADLWEFDVVFFDQAERITLCEIVLSKNNLDGIEDEIRLKKRLVVELFGVDVFSLLISAVDIQNREMTRVLRSDLRNDIACFPFPEESLDREISSGDRTQIAVPPRSSLVDSKFCYWNELKTRKGLNYERDHEVLRESLLSHIAKGEKKSAIQQVVGPSNVRRVIIGNLDRNAVDYLLGAKIFMVKNQRLETGNFEKHFSKIVLSLSLPNLRPIFYFRERRTPRFIKMGPATETRFEFERNIIPRFGTFFIQLEKLGHSITSDIVDKVLTSMLTKEVLGRSTKAGHHPQITLD